MLISDTQKKIISILADGKLHSGTDLAEMLDMSRSAICKQLKNLTDLGIECSAITGKGYRFKNSLQLLSTEAINQYLTPKSQSLISALEIYQSIHSTNSYLLELAQQENSSGTVCFSEYQTAGRGRRGREWVSPFGSNIYLSILWQFQSGPASISGLSLAVGLAVVKALKDCGVEGVGLKWPNDIYWQHKKLAGILIEVSGETNGPCHAVIGLGLNFYLPKDKAESITQDWVDLSHILGANPSEIRNKLAATLLNHLMPMITGFDDKGLDSYIEEWRVHDCMQGKQVQIFMGKQVFSGTVTGIDNNGLLLLADEQGQVKAFASGEVSFSSS